MSQQPCVTVIVGMDTSPRYMPAVTSFANKPPSLPGERYHVTLSDGRCHITAHMTRDQLQTLVTSARAALMLANLAVPIKPSPETPYAGPELLADGETIAVQE